MKFILTLISILVSLPCFAQWQDTKFSGYNTEVSAIGVHDTDLFVASSMMVSNTRNHLVYRYTPANAANPWTVVESGLDGSQSIVTSFVTLGPYLFAGMSHLGDPGAIYRTRTRGDDWIQTVGTTPFCTNGSNLFFDGYEYNGSRIVGPFIFTSRDSGNTADSLSNIAALRYAASGGCVLVTSSVGLWQSLNAGHTWTKISPYIPNSLSWIGQAVYAISGGQLNCSRDSGSSRSQISVDSAGTPVGVNCVASFGTHLFAGTSKGVFVSNDTGKTWTAKNEAILYRDVFPVNMNLYPIVKLLAVYDTFLLAEAQYGDEVGGTFHLWMRPISQLIGDSVRLAVNESVIPLATLRINPNPLTNFATISYEIPERTPVAIEIMNVLGEPVATVLDREYEAGSYSETFDSQQLPSGIYWCQMRTAHSTLLQKLAIQK